MNPHQDTQLRTPLTTEEKAAIKKANRFKKICKRIKHGFLSIRNSEVKTILTAWLVVGSTALLINRQQVQQNLLADGFTLPMPLHRIDTSGIIEWLFEASIYAIPAIAIFLSVLMFGIFGVSIWTAKVENACITQGIYKNTQSPWLLQTYRQSVYRVFKIYLNGSCEDDFKRYQKGLESELGKIEDFVMEGTDILYLYVLTGRSRRNPNRASLDF